MSLYLDASATVIRTELLEGAIQVVNKIRDSVTLSDQLLAERSKSGHMSISIVSYCSKHVQSSLGLFLFADIRVFIGMGTVGHLV